MSLVLLLAGWLAAVGARAQGDHLLIADFDDLTGETRAGLSLWIFADEQLGGTSDARTTSIRPGVESGGALRIAFRVTDEFANPFAGAWAMVASEGMPTDLSAYRGVRFHARSNHPAAFTAGLVQFSGALRRYMTPFETRTEWTRVELPFARFREITPAGKPVADASAANGTAITSIGFSVATGLRGAFELDIDRIEFYR